MDFPVNIPVWLRFKHIPLRLHQFNM